MELLPQPLQRRLPALRCHHALGLVQQAIDFRIVGVPNRTLFDYCRGFSNVGCGYYPNSDFIHMDVRTYKTQWTDYSRPGQAPVYAHRNKKRSNAKTPKGKAAKGKAAKGKATKGKAAKGKAAKGKAADTKASKEKAKRKAASRSKKTSTARGGKPGRSGAKGR